MSKLSRESFGVEGVDGELTDVVVGGVFFQWHLIFSLTGGVSSLGVSLQIGVGGDCWGGEFPLLSSTLSDIIERVQSTVNSGYWVCPCWGNFRAHDSSTSNNKNICFQRALVVHLAQLVWIFGLKLIRNYQGAVSKRAFRKTNTISKKQPV